MWLCETIGGDEEQELIDLSALESFLYFVTFIKHLSPVCSKEKGYHFSTCWVLTQSEEKKKLSGGKKMVVLQFLFLHTALRFMAPEQ